MNRQKDWLLEVANVILIFAEIAFVFALIGVVIGVILVIWLLASCVSHLF